MNPSASGTVQPPVELCGVARRAIAAHLARERYAPQQLSAPWDHSRGVFVTLRTRAGELRGCIGHLEPAYPTLAQEVASCAVSAATRDTRFPPVDAAELPDLTIDINVLCPAEPVRDPAELDPARYGVIVSSDDRRGVLLPGIAGVDRVDEQLRIAARKAGIPQGAPITVERFEVLEVAESD